MKLGLYKRSMFAFILTIILGMLFTHMNILVYRLSDIYISFTLFYTGLLLASKMLWGHEIIYYLCVGTFSIETFVIGSILTIITILLMREQIFVNDKDWIRWMIPHQSAGLTTVHKIYNRTTDPSVKATAKELIKTYEKEIQLMKDML